MKRWGSWAESRHRRTPRPQGTRARASFDSPLDPAVFDSHRDCHLQRVLTESANLAGHVAAQRVPGDRIEAEALAEVRAALAGAVVEQLRVALRARVVEVARAAARDVVAAEHVFARARQTLDLGERVLKLLGL